MKTDYATALKLAAQVGADQDYPAAALYVVATPIGNLADISLRALHVLGLVDVLACEDTRHTQNLLRAYGIEGQQHWLALHQHNERAAADTVLACLRQGQRVAYVSDAGTPGVSDPGCRLVSQVREAGLLVVPIPGVSSVTTLISVAGALDGSGSGAWLFRGFLPQHGAARQRALSEVQSEARAQVLLEAPHRIGDLANAVQALGARRITVGRELTKSHEEVATMAADQLHAWLQESGQRSKGEFALVVHACESPTVAAEDRSATLLQRLLEHMPLKTAVALAMEITGQPRKVLYARALELQGARNPD